MDEVRMARTESAFREVNEAIARTSARFGASEAQFVCECSDPTCSDRVTVRLAEYERVRRDATTFLLAPGHHAPALESVLKRTDDYEVIEKLGVTMRRVARRLDPRRQRPQPEIT